MKKHNISPTPLARKCKGMESEREIQAFRKLFLSGGKFTAKELNQLTGSNDARKYISRLRAEGWDIEDMLQDDGSKIYWLSMKGGEK
ncbi:hypothetical protein [Paraprevotella xylaniphila]|uniref:hypothetical protein n=1 Tax=Paraprevotella xylaniphila TaxID=454155 RepID=UPI002061A073|nr:hypothetical protein [Paraprevotella xylaniphila]DAZ47091.1 MAG TPA: helix-turn-helix domain protein [Caudoviricetes sp.]